MILKQGIKVDNTDAQILIQNTDILLRKMRIILVKKTNPDLFVKLLFMIRYLIEIKKGCPHNLGI
jgi:hypothetical protein